MVGICVGASDDIWVVGVLIGLVSIVVCVGVSPRVYVVVNVGSFESNLGLYMLWWKMGVGFLWMDLKSDVDIVVFV